MNKKLVIVESPAKARTISRYLGSGYIVKSSMGHIIDLPPKELGVDIENNFEPTYKIIKGKKKIIDEIKKAAKECADVYIATDPDREGEAIAWHLKERINTKKISHKFFRVELHEIIESSIKEAFKHSTDINMNRVYAQQSRRLLDRVVGYLLSPLLWKKIARGLSAGRVQSIALKFIVEREKEREGFKSEEYWQIKAKLKKKNADSLIEAQLAKIDSKKVEIPNKKKADSIVSDLNEEKFIVADIKEKEENRYPGPPFITSTLQQEAFNRLRFDANRTMYIAQQLYEGMELGESATMGLITYMRTDSTRVADFAQKKARQYIEKVWSAEFLPKKPPVYKTKRRIQGAHEAIRPTNPEFSPDKVKEFLTDEQYKLYDLIWKKFIASQMTPARYSSTKLLIRAGKCDFEASGSRVIFSGFTQVYPVKRDDVILPKVSVKEELDLEELMPSQHFTKPPARYTQASLIKELEKKDIGRPSTYAPIMRTLTQRNYVLQEDRRLYPTQLAKLVIELLDEYFKELMDEGFTANMENVLDNVEAGEVDWHKALEDFYAPFRKSLNIAEEKAEKRVILTEFKCPECGKPLAVKWGKRGKFLSCSGFPECKFSKSFPTGVKCPEDGCDGMLVERRSRKGQTFYGCSNFPNCRFTASKLPAEESKEEEEEQS